MTVIEYVTKNADRTFTNQIYNLCDDGYISLNNLLRLNKQSTVIRIPTWVSNKLLNNLYLKNILLRLYGNFVLHNEKLKTDMSVKLNATQDDYL